MRACFFALVAFSCGPAAGADWHIGNRVVIEHGTLSIDHSKSVKEISAAQAKGGFKADHGVGLFQNRIKTELAFTELAVPNKRLSLTTKITTTPVIYVARELPKDSCSYQLVLGHELQHQEYDLEVLRAMPDEIQNLSQDVFDTGEIDRTGSLNQARARSRFFQQFNFVYKTLGEMRHPVIDSPESYRRLSGLCNGGLAAYIPVGPAPKAVAKKSK
ncbi:MAG: hypothetical protein B7Y41_14900 [Hydrogenophilales bacterium 28-61-23]|nr:MAG: hypothetical protein B7Y41_14900 [Hydrogenophilales bacterium 28-61-23]